MTLTLKNDQWVTWQGREGRVVRSISLHDAQLRDRNGDIFTAPIAELMPLDIAQSARPVRTVDSQKNQVIFQQAQQRLDAIRPLLDLGLLRKRRHVEQRAQELNCSPATLYRWIRNYESGDFNSLVHQRRRDAGKGRLSEEVEQVMQRLIDRRYLTSQRPTMTEVYRTLLLEIQTMNNNRAEGEPEVLAPTYQTFRRRIYQTSERKRVSRRYGEGAAKRSDPITGRYPGATYPLAVVQADHTQLDIKLVDSVHRQPMAGRPWITLVMDVFSRVVLGFHISLDAPSTYSVGQALTHAILPKTLWLARHREEVKRVLGDLTDEELEIDWPCWGKPVKFMVDNGREFWGEMLHRTCAQYAIDQEFRPVLRPEYGSHIERILGTVAVELHSLPGTTFSNIAERGKYDSEARATMTFEGLQVWLTAFLLGAYHNREHSELGMTPLEMWEKGLLEGTETHPPTGLPAIFTGDRAERLKMDLLPFFEATVQREGVRNEGMVYQDPVLHAYVKAKHPERTTRSRLFTFRYDPTDISQVYFLDPELNRYFPVRCIQPDFPSISIWEMRAAKKFGKAQGLEVKDTRTIMNAYQLMRRVAEREEEQTKHTRREQERRRQRARAPKATDSVAKPKLSTKRPALSVFSDLGDIQPFDDIDT
ncbi:helix-turn-helix domain-containing protein [Deinococcus radiophilus]|uniref:helix-turn-helix domain-containing protein n=1 Tax=Deinococcus radiophilus TaxID=32062 RepID=UPI001E47349A|nr:helix-turn-helix domain-containing protein [Deinococcus radiophilus]UFA49684.1 Mu transposase C-terminal domain-containing protein [Deinococcus radiophilus]